MKIKGCMLGHIIDSHVCFQHRACISCALSGYGPAERNPIRTKAHVNEIPIARIPVRTKIPSERTPIRTKDEKYSFS